MPAIRTPNATRIIRPLAAADEPQWRRLWTLYLEYYQTTRPEAVFATTFARLLSPDATEFRALVAEQDGALVGLTHYLFHRHNWHLENVCYLQDLYADPSVRGTGVGRALITAVYAAADAANSPKVYWFTEDFNATGRQLYDRIGELTPFIRYRRP